MTHRLSRRGLLAAGASAAALSALPRTGFAADPWKVKRSVCTPASSSTSTVPVSAKVVPPNPFDVPLLSGSAKVLSGVPSDSDTAMELPPIAR